MARPLLLVALGQPSRALAGALPRAAKPRVPEAETRDSAARPARPGRHRPKLAPRRWAEPMQRAERRRRLAAAVPLPPEWRELEAFRALEE